MNEVGPRRTAVARILHQIVGDPPVLAGAVHVTPSWALPLTATTDVGALGTVDRIPIELCETNATTLEVS